MELGVALVTETTPNWQGVQVPILREMKATIARIPVAPGFGNDPAMLADLKALGVRTVLLNVENSDGNGSMVDKAVRDLFDRGWYVAAHSAGLTAIVEVGNEPDHTSLTPQQQAADITATIGTLDRRVTGIPIAISLPTTLAYTQALSPLFGSVDALAPHYYGGEQLGDAAGGEQAAVLAWVHDHTTMPLYLSEIGIDSPGTAIAEKARRMLDGLARLDQERVRGACVFTISTDPSWAHYALDLDAARVFGAREATFAGGPTPPPTPPAPPVKPVPPADPFAFTDPVTKYVIRDGMLARYNQLRRALSAISPDEVLLVIGRPVENEHADPDGFTRQRFEHVTLTWKHAQSPPRFDILEEIVNPFRPMP